MRITIVIAAIVVFAGAAAVLLWLRVEPVREPAREPAPVADRPEPAPATPLPAEPPAPEPEESAPPDPEPELPPGAPEPVVEEEPPPVVPAPAEEAEPADVTPPEPPRAPEPEKEAGVPAPPEPAPPVPEGPASYVGAAACMACHEAEDHTWKQRRHAAAWKTLPAKYRDPAAKDDDGRACISCHVTGYGRADRNGFVDPSRSSHLLGVQCEACHGPGSRHVLAAERAAASGAKPGEITGKPTNCTGCHNPHVSYEQFK